jgi:hypothetical protein
MYESVENGRGLSGRSNLEPDLVWEQFKSELKEGTTVLLASREVDGVQDHLVTIFQSHSHGSVRSKDLVNVGGEELSPLLAASRLVGCRKRAGDG